MANAVLLCSSDYNDSIFAASVANDLGLPLTHHADRSRIDQAIGGPTPPIAIFLSIKDLAEMESSSEAIHILAGRSRSKIPPIFYITAMPIEALALALNNPWTSFYLRATYADAADDGKQFAGVLKMVLRKEQILKDLYRPILHLDKFNLDSIDYKKHLLSQIRKATIDAGFAARLSAKMGIAADELLLNALKDAPENHALRSLEKIPNKGVDVICGRSASRFFISVTDQFGSFEKNKALNCLANSREKISLSNGNKSAGLGLAMVLKSGASLVISDQHGRSTSALASWPIGVDARGLQKAHQFFGILND
ncbi:MAG: hypothetical protein EOP06_09185 [Proteobacteria bacterium]|nr:MAG: hypothetical protein EOP06_09185 [Pseudomonadota bacterium]